ncbi:hypothetical protein MMC07_007155, partial [Pseudocyphellaria aurata]|nr:hypothetical protein [Pseudocyphellaria aurata]
MQNYIVAPFPAHSRLDLSVRALDRATQSEPIQEGTDSPRSYSARIARLSQKDPAKLISKFPRRSLPPEEHHTGIFVGSIRDITMKQPKHANKSILSSPIRKSRSRSPHRDPREIDIVRGRLPSLDEVIPEMGRLRTKTSAELAKLSCKLRHDPRGPHASMSPTHLHRVAPAGKSRRQYHGHHLRPGHCTDKSHYGYKDKFQSNSGFSGIDDVVPLYTVGQPAVQLPIHSGPPNRNSCSSSSSNDFSDRRASLASGSTATTYSGPSNQPGYSNGNSPESSTTLLAPIRTHEQSGRLAQAPAAYDCGDSQRNSMLLQQPYYEPRLYEMAGSVHQEYSPGYAQEHSPYEQGYSPRYEQGHSPYEQEYSPRHEQGHSPYEQGHSPYEQGQSPHAQNRSHYEQIHAHYQQSHPHYEPSHPHYEQSHPRHEQRHEPRYDQIRDAVAYPQESRAIPESASRQPSSRQPANRPNGKRQSVDQQSKTVNFAKTDEKPKKRRGNLPKAVTDLLRQWFHDHIAHPYPTEDEKQRLMHETGLNMSQISNWFINARRRNLPQLNKQAAAESALREKQ